MAASAFGNALVFMQNLGVFDVVLPFLLVFTLVFAFLEKTKIFGTDKYRGDDGKLYDVPRKSMNSMMAFTMAFFVIASTQLVALISELVSKVVLVLVLVFSFTLTVGAFQKQEAEGFYLKKGWKTTFEIIAFIAIFVIFLDALGWLDTLFDWLGGIWSNEAGAALLMVLVLIGFMAIVIYEPNKAGSKSKKEEKS